MPAVAPINVDIVSSRITGILANVAVLDTRLMRKGVRMIAGIYVGHSGTVNNANADIARIASGLTVPPQHPGFQQTKVVTADTGASVTIRITLIHSFVCIACLC